MNFAADLAATNAALLNFLLPDADLSLVAATTDDDDDDDDDDEEEEDDDEEEEEDDDEDGDEDDDLELRHLTGSTKRKEA